MDQEPKAFCAALATVVAIKLVRKNKPEAPVPAFKALQAKLFSSFYAGRSENHYTLMSQLVDRDSFLLALRLFHSTLQQNRKQEEEQLEKTKLMAPDSEISDSSGYPSSSSSSYGETNVLDFYTSSSRIPSFVKSMRAFKRPVPQSGPLSINDGFDSLPKRQRRSKS